MTDLLAQTVADVRDFISIPSYHGNTAGLLAGAKFVEDHLRAAGFDVQRVSSNSPPYVIGHRPGATTRSLLVYMMYDIRPAADAGDGPAIRSSEAGDILWSPLPVGNKAASLAFVAALRTLPVEYVPSVTVLAEGVETIGSPGLEDAVDRLPQGQSTDRAWAFWPRDVRDPTGKARLHLSYRGMLGIRLIASGSAAGGPADRPVHSQFRPWVHAPAWRLIDALHVARYVPELVSAGPLGYGDWTEVLTADLTARMAELGIAVDLTDLDNALRRAETGTTVNLELEAAFSPGVGEIQPNAAARLQYRIPPDVPWEDVLAVLRSQLHEEGLDDVECRPTYALTGATLDAEGALCKALERAYRLEGIAIEHWPVGLSTPPIVAFRSRLGLPIADGGAGSVLAVDGGEAIAIHASVSSSIPRQIDFYRSFLQELTRAELDLP